jgi:hypothetical protein
VLVVWEPILFTDWSPPSRSALARIADRRARQFWDPRHLVTRDLSRAATRHPALAAPSCCLHDRLHWDEAILYPPGSHWHDAPAPAVWDGPVAEIIPRLEATLGASRPEEALAIMDRARPLYRQFEEAAVQLRLH